MTAYDLNTEAAEYLNAMSTSRYNFASTLMEKWIYVFGGYERSCCERYANSKISYHAFKRSSTANSVEMKNNG